MGAPGKAFQQLTPVFAPVNALLSPPDPYWDGPVFDLRETQSLRGGGGSDHASFIAAGVPGLNWGLKGRANYFAHSWHTQWDTMNVVIPEYQRHTATVIALVALGTANMPELLDRSQVQRGGGRRGQSAGIAEAIFGAKMEGLKFTTVTSDGQAGKMGIQKGDVLAKLNGEDIERLRDIFTIMRDGEGEVLTFTVKRGDKTVDVKMRRDAVGGRRRR